MAGSRRNTVIYTQTAEINNHQYKTVSMPVIQEDDPLPLWAGTSGTQAMAVFTLAAVIALHHQQVTGLYQEFDSLLYWLGIKTRSVNLPYDPQQNESLFTSPLWAASSSLNLLFFFFFLNLIIKRAAKM